MKDNNTAVELFAGVGGFRIGMNDVKLLNNEVIEKDNWNIVFSNQWEPSTKTQHAFNCYIERFGENKNIELRKYENYDISKVPAEVLPNHKLLVGGFPCQDYSVARSLKNEGGIEGKKGVLWWEINKIIEAKKPKFILLENVDRLLKSPSKQRGRDFGIMLRTLSDNGYDVEWRVINAAEYGFVQRRRRIFIFGYYKETNYYKMMKKYTLEDILLKHSIYQKSFPAILSDRGDNGLFNINNDYKDLVDLSNNFSFNFQNSGIMQDGEVYSVRLESSGDYNTVLKDILETEVDEEFFLSDKQIEQFNVLRGSKSKERTRPDGSKYMFTEGKLSEHDDINLPGRTMLTSEGTTNRSTHIIKDPYKDKLRFITPIEAERLNMFPDNWTQTANMSKRKRYFTMGNALVTGIIKRITDEILNID